MLLNTTHFFIIKIPPKKQERQEIAFNHLPHFTAKVIDATLSSDNLLRSKKNLLGRI